MLSTLPTPPPRPPNDCIFFYVAVLLQRKKKKGGRWRSVFVQAAITEHQTGKFINNRHLFLTILGAESQDWGPAWLNEGSLPGCRFHAVYSCGKRGKGLLGASFIRALIPLMAPTSWFKHLPTTSPPYAITLEGQDFNIWIWGGNIQTIAGRIQRDPQRKRSRSMFFDLQVIS